MLYISYSSFFILFATIRHYFLFCVFYLVQKKLNLATTYFSYFFCSPFFLTKFDSNYWLTIMCGFETVFSRTEKYFFSIFFLILNDKNRPQLQHNKTRIVIHNTGIFAIWLVTNDIIKNLIGWFLNVTIWCFD